MIGKWVVIIWTGLQWFRIRSNRRFGINCTEYSESAAMDLVLLTFSHLLSKFCQPSHFLNGMQNIIKQIVFIAFLSYKLQMKTRLFTIIPFVCIRSVIVANLYFHSLIHIPLQVFWFRLFLVVFLQNTYRTEAVV